MGVAERPENRAGRRWLAWLGIIGFVAVFLALPEFFPGNSKLYDAIGAGDAALVEELLRSGADPDSQAGGLAGLGSGIEELPWDNYSPLMYALRRNEAECALRLVLAGARPDARNPQGETALMLAANNGMVDVVRALLERGADPHARHSYNDSTALFGQSAFAVNGHVSEKNHLDPEILAVLRAAVARAQ